MTRPWTTRTELTALRSGCPWLAPAVCATTSGGVLSAYSYIAPLLTDRAGLAAGLVPLVLVGFGLGAKPVLISLALRFAGKAPTLGSALTISAFNLGTAAGSWIAGLALDSSVGATGPAMMGTAIAVLTLIPTIAMARAAAVTG
ncbi:MFS transporter [Streptomyces justiciae]|uniref:MFS transporter n=1 Tax=Streptomyces justiciae TaxID=2780140 RepID=A0ABU3LRZ2_9ACTN|nr:hypothetical protein [Streptomyces justiciae]MDT7841996.1 hypothetical protein [Streptomyces justiciae]